MMLLISANVNKLLIVPLVGFWKSEPFKCFAVTQGGEFISATMENSFVAPLVLSG